jgi:hypothetical protein
MQFRHEYIRDRAYFVAGLPATFRAYGDPKVESAIRDAESYLERLPDNFYEPVVSGATSVSKENILVLTWLVLDREDIKAVTATFFGRGICSVSWPDESEDRAINNITLSELIAINLPEVISRFRLARKQAS